MKVLDIKTIKGEFILLDLSKFNKNVTDAYVTHIDYNLNNVIIQDIDAGEYVFGAEFAFPVEIIGSVKHMTEEQFAEVVDSITWIYTIGGSNTVYRNYLCNNEISGSGVLESAKQSLESLVKSLGWYLFDNPVPPYAPNDVDFHESAKKWFEAESKTLYNPVLLKKV